MRLRNTWSVRCAAVQTLLKCETVVQTSEWLLNLLRNLLFGVFRNCWMRERMNQRKTILLLLFFPFSSSTSSFPLWDRPAASLQRTTRLPSSIIEQFEFEVKFSNGIVFHETIGRKNRTPCITRRLLYTEWGTIFIYGEVVVGQLRGAAIIQSSRTI